MAYEKGNLGKMLGKVKAEAAADEESAPVGPILTEPEENAPLGPEPPLPPPEPAERGTSRVGFGKNMGSRGSKTEAPPVPPGAPAGPPRVEKPETDPVAEAKKKMEEASEEYAKIYGQARAQRKWFQKILDINVEKQKNNPEVADARKKFLEAREIYIKEAVRDFKERSSGKYAGQQFTEEIKKFTDELLGKSLADLATAKNDRALQYNIDRGWIAKNVADPYMKLSRWIGKRPWYVQVAIYGSLLGVGVASALTGAAALSYGAYALGVGLRVARAGAAGEGIRGLTQSAAQWYRKWKGESDTDTAAIIAEQSGIPAERRDSVEGRLEHLEDYLLRENAKLDKRLVRREGGDKWRRRMGIFAGAFVGGGGMSYLIGGLGGGSWLKEKISSLRPGGTPAPEIVGAKPTAPLAAGPAVPDTQPAKFSGQGLEHTGHGEFSGDYAKINKGGSIWRSTREIFMRHPGEYGYSEEEAQRLFKSFRSNGNLRRLGMRGIESFSDLSDGQKHKIWAEWKTATTINEYKLSHGGKITDLVHPGDTVRLDEHGKLFIGETSGLKAGYLHDVQRPRGAGAAAYEPQGRNAAALHESGGKKVIDISEYEQRRQAAIAKGLDADARLAEIRGPIAAQLAEEAKLIKAAGVAQVSDYLNLMEGKISGVKIDPNGKAIDLYNQLKQRVLITSDQPMAPSSDIFDQNKNWKVLQEIYRKLGKPQYPNERTADWIYRGILDKKISPESIQLSLPAVNE